MEPHWRLMIEADLDDVSRIAAAAHPEALSERPDVFAEKLGLFPRGCLAFALGERVAGYAFSHPWMLGDAPALDAFLGALPESPDCLYLHDLAIAAEARGRGEAARAIASLTALAAAERLGALALIAVQGTDRFWTRAGFLDAPAPRLAAKLAGYGPGARYMIRRAAAQRAPE